jgi:NitT/TauT family transport system substrate-binding protein
VARNKGFFAEEGIEVDFTYTSEQIAALVGGSVDIIHDAGDQGLAARKRGVDIVAIHSAVTKPTQYLVALPEFKTISQLKGQQLAVSDINSTDYLVLAALLKTNGIAENEVTFRKVGFSSARLSAVEQKQVAGTLLTASTWLDGRRKVQGLNLMATPKNMVEFPWDTMQVNRKWAQEHESVVVGYLRAFIKGTRWLVDPANTGEAVAILKPETKLADDDIKDLLGVLLSDQIYRLDQPIVAAPFQRYADALIQAKAMEPPVDITGFIDTSFFEKARQK